MIIKLYHIMPVKIDYNKLMEERKDVVSYFEIEILRIKKLENESRILILKNLTRTSLKLLLSRLSEIYYH